MALTFKKDLSWLPLTLTPAEIVDVASTGNINNVETRTTDSLAAVLRFTGAAPTVTGLVAGRRKISLMAVGGPLILANENGGSLAANRIVTGTGADLTIAEGAGAELAYDTKSARWRVTSGGGSPGGGDVSTENGDAPQDAGQVSTTDDTPTNIGDAITLASDTVATIDLAVQCIQQGAAKAKIFSVRRSFLNDGGAVTDGTQQDLITAEELGGSLAASVAITRTGTTVQPKVTGVAATALRWYLISQSMQLGAASAGAVPDAPLAIDPAVGSEDGGTAVEIEVADSTGLTGAKVGGVALIGFAIDDATHVSGTTGAHAAGAVDVVVTNANGDSAALAGAFTYNAGAGDWLATDLAGLRLWYRVGLHATNVSGKCSQLTDASGVGDSNRNATQGTALERPTITTANANFNNRDTIDFVAAEQLVTGTFAAPDAQAFTIGLVLRPTASGAIFVFDDIDGTARVALFDSGTDNPSLYAGAILTGDDGAYTVDTTHVLVLEVDGASSKIYVNAYTTPDVTGDAGSTALTSLKIGDRYDDTAPWEGSLAEIIVYSGIDATKRQTMVEELGALYGVTVGP